MISLRRHGDLLPLRPPIAPRSDASLLPCDLRLVRVDLLGHPLARDQALGWLGESWQAVAHALAAQRPSLVPLLLRGR